MFGIAKKVNFCARFSSAFRGEPCICPAHEGAMSWPVVKWWVRLVWRARGDGSAARRQTRLVPIGIDGEEQEGADREGVGGVNFDEGAGKQASCRCK